MRWAAVLIVIVVAGVFHLTRPVDPEPGSDCEPIHAAAVREPANTLSAVALVGAGLHVVRRRKEAPFGWTIAAAGSASALFHATAHPIAATLDLIGALAAVAAALWLIWSRRLRLWSIGPAAATFAIGAAIWIGSRTGARWCFPDAVVNGHAIWHLTAAVAALLLARAADRHGTRPAS